MSSSKNAFHSKKILPAFFYTSKCHVLPFFYGVIILFSYFCILLVVSWCFSLLTACCHLFILYCLHVKPNVINLFNRLSLLADQTPLPASVKDNHTQDSIENVFVDDVKTDDIDCDKADVANNNLADRKFIMSSSLQLHEDDLSRIDVKSLVSEFIGLILIHATIPRSSYHTSHSRDRIKNLQCILLN